MTLTFSKLGKSGKVAFYTGAAITLSIGVSAFPGKTAPSTIEVADGVFAAKVVKEAKIKETKEERKARLAALPKKTAAQKLADLEAKTAALRAKLAAGDSAAM